MFFIVYIDDRSTSFVVTLHDGQDVVGETKTDEEVKNQYNVSAHVTNTTTDNDQHITTSNSVEGRIREQPTHEKNTHQSARIQPRPTEENKHSSNVKDVTNSFGKYFQDYSIS